MKWHERAALAAACAAALQLFPPGLWAQALTVTPFKTGTITFAVHATKVPDFVGTIASVKAEFRGTDLSNVTGTVEVRVADMHTGVGLRDTHMRRAMNADSFP